MSTSLITDTDFTECLYEHGKVCLTAASAANMDCKYRPYLALFADGTFLVDERAQTDEVLQALLTEFRTQYPSKNRQKPQYVSQRILKAIYHKAQDFDWYLPQYKLPQDFGANEKRKMKAFLQRILRRQCLSITTITTPEWFRFYSPDKGKFALFSGGWLAIAEDSPYMDVKTHNLSELCPQIEMVEVVPTYYIDAVYESLLYTQPSAREIYIDLVRDKMMKRLNISSEEASEIMQKQTYGWRKLLLMPEVTARSMIYSEYVENCFMQTDERFALQMKNKKDFHIGVFI